MADYVVKDSGARVDYPSGMRRDIDDDKPRYDLIPRPMLKRWAELLARGAKKYGTNNWQLADSEEELARFKASAFRHFIQWLEGEQDEDHGMAVFFNIGAAEHVKEKLEKQRGVIAAGGPASSMLNEVIMRVPNTTEGMIRQSSDTGAAKALGDA